MDAMEQRITRVGRLLEALERCLLDEQQMLMDQDIDALRDVAARKETLLRRLEDEQRGHRPQKDAEDRPEMSAIREALERCQALTRENARLIDRGVARVEQALRLLRSPDGFTCYAPRPPTRTYSDRSTRTLAVA